MNKEIQIDCKNLCIGYNQKNIAENIDFCVYSGDYLCVVGENGSGKSTLIKTLLSLLEKTGGEIVFNPKISTKQIGYLPQQTIIQKDFPALVCEVVLSGFQNKSRFGLFYSKKQKELAMQNLDKLGILNLSKCCYRELSGGQQQRVLLARALCSAQDILVLDEPVSNLDPIATKEMYELIKKLNEQGMTIIMITHDISSSMKYASHILFMGSKCFFGTKEEFENSNMGEKHKHFVGGCTNE